MATHDLVERDCQRIARGAPASDLSKLQCRDASQFGQVEILVRDGVSPFIEQFQRGLAKGILRINLYHMIPKLQTQAGEVGSDIPRIWIPFVEFSSLDELGFQNRNQTGWRRPSDQAASTFGMQVPTKTLKLR